MKKRGKSFIGPASIPRRLIAFIIDIMIIDLVILTPFYKLFQRFLPPGTFTEQLRFIQENPQVSIPTHLLLVIGILIVLYFSYFEYKIHQTPGKIILGLYTMQERAKPSFWAYLLSNITFIPIFPFILLWIIDPLYMFITPKNQRLMEKLNRILVVQRYKY